MTTTLHIIAFVFGAAFTFWYLCAIKNFVASKIKSNRINIGDKVTIKKSSASHYPCLYCKELIVDMINSNGDLVSCKYHNSEFINHVIVKASLKKVKP